MVGEIETAVHPDAVLEDFLVFLRIDGPVAWLRDVVFHRRLHAIGYSIRDVQRSVALQ
jgi:hypothetical protein